LSAFGNKSKAAKVSDTTGAAFLFGESMKGKIVDYTNMKIGHITVLSLIERKKGKSYWRCRCDCGNEFVGEIYAIKYRIEKCGQLWCKKCRPEALVKHGDSRHSKKRERLYTIWEGMRYRCEKKYASHYENYGGRGIKVCDEWQDYITFKAWALSNGYQDNLSIDRINANGNYEPSNCRWATSKEQMNNTRETRRVEYCGKMVTFFELAKIVNIPQATLHDRIIAKKWSIDRAVNTPYKKPNRYDGINVRELAIMAGVDEFFVYHNLAKGMSLEEALMKPKSRKKAVYKLDHDGTVISRYNSVLEAEKSNGITHGKISATINGKRKTAGGYKWAFA
jgi:hypothetical protein